MVTLKSKENFLLFLFCFLFPSSSLMPDHLKKLTLTWITRPFPSPLNKFSIYKPNKVFTLIPLVVKIELCMCKGRWEEHFVLQWVRFALLLATGSHMDPNWLQTPDSCTEPLHDKKEWMSPCQWRRRIRWKRCKGKQTALIPQLLFEKCHSTLYRIVLIRNNFCGPLTVCCGKYWANSRARSNDLKTDQAQQKKGLFEHLSFFDTVFWEDED